MKKIKLNIQMFASTNKTTNYELPQFVGTDKPSWLGDFNEAMLTIDTGMHGNATAIDSVESTSQTAKSTANQALQGVSSLSDTVSSQGSAISSIDGRVTTINSTLTTQGTAISSIDGRVTTLETDNTTNKANIQALEDYLNINTFESVPMGTLTRGTIQTQNINVAKNSDGSLAKIYGSMTMNVNSNLGTTFEMQTSLRPDQDIQINMLGIRQFRDSFTELYTINPIIHTDGRVTFENMNTSVNMQNQKIILFPCVLFIKNFGDVEN